MSAVLEYPLIEGAAQTPAAVDKKRPTLKETLLAQFAAERPSMEALAAKYANVAYPVTTTKGLAEAKAARNDLRENGRYMLQRTLESLKQQANDLKKLAEAETETLVALVKPVEDAIDEQIKAEEKRQADEKAENERKDAERKQKLRDAIQAIRGKAQGAIGQSAENIQTVINAMQAWTFPKERWQEFAIDAANATCETLEKLRQLHAAAIAPTPAPTAAPTLVVNTALVRANAAVGQALRDLDAASTVTLGNGDKADPDSGEVLERATQAPTPAPCAGANCGAPAGSTAHSHECHAEHDALANAAQVADEAARDDKPAFNVGDICGRFGRGCMLTSEFIEETLAVPHTGRGHRGIKLWSEKDVRRAAAALAAIAQRVGTTGVA